MAAVKGGNGGCCQVLTCLASINQWEWHFGEVLGKGDAEGGDEEGGSSISGEATTARRIERDGKREDEVGLDTFDEWCVRWTPVGFRSVISVCLSSSARA